MTTNKPTELVVTQADRDTLDAIWLACMRASGRNDPADEACLQILAAHRLEALRTQGVTVAALYGYEAGFEEGKRLASTAPASEPQIAIERCSLCGTQAPKAFANQCNRPECVYRAPASEDDLDHLAELLANFARDRFANTKELTWATMGEHSQQYFRDAVAVVLAALRPRSEREEIANWLREDAPQWGHEALANAIERGDFKEPSERA